MADEVCIYCWRRGGTTAFSDEHVIPACIYGRLILRGYVCAQCNSWLGENVDHHILKVPDILSAHRALGLHDRYTELLKNNYKVRLVDESGKEFIGRTATPHPELLTQRLEDGRLIFPEETGMRGLRNSLGRIARRREVPLQTSEEELGRILSWAKDGESENEINSPTLGLQLRKETRKLRHETIPVVRPETDRLIAKIAYEFMFLVGYRRLYQLGDLPKTLKRAISGEVKPQGLIIFRGKARTDSPRPAHFIRFYNYAGFPMVEVGFFGVVSYSLFAMTRLTPGFFKCIGAAFGCPDLVGVQYEMLISNVAQRLWGIQADGTAKELKREQPSG